MESVRKGKGLTPDWEELMRENEVPGWYMIRAKRLIYVPQGPPVAYVMMAFESLF
jgi:DNA polymerase-3 subunit alpha (Gram-positive type)